MLAGKKRRRDSIDIDNMSIHSSELASENLNDSDEDNQNPHGFLVGQNLNTFWKSKWERLAESFVPW